MSSLFAFDQCGIQYQRPNNGFKLSHPKGVQNENDVDGYN